MTPPPLTAKLEALLFVAAEPLSLERLAAAAGASESDTAVALKTLAAQTDRGITLSELDGHYRLVTNPAASAVVRKFLQDESKSDLSKPALETLAIVAYRGPLTRSQVEAVRGVASESMLRNLLARGLIREAGKSSEPGRPQLYSVSHSFLQHFGLQSPADLPPLPGANEEAHAH